MRVFVRDPDNCTGCLMCALACSHHRCGGYNPRRALIQPRRQITGLVEEHDFLEACDAEVAECCRQLEGALPCVRECFYGVLKAESS